MPDKTNHLYKLTRELPEEFSYGHKLFRDELVPHITRISELTINESDAIRKVLAIVLGWLDANVGRI